MDEGDCVLLSIIVHLVFARLLLAERGKTAFNSEYLRVLVVQFGL